MFRTFAVATLLLSVVLIVRILLAHDELAISQGAAGDHDRMNRILALASKAETQQQRVERKLKRLAEELQSFEQHQKQAGEQPAAGEALAPKARSSTMRESTVFQAATTEAEASTETCPKPPNKFHALLTSQSSPYQQWQSRIMYYHWKKQRAVAGPCGDMGGFTRLCATPGGRPDGLEIEIPSVFTVELSEEVLAKHFQFGVLNRPNSVKQLLESQEMMSHIKSEYVLILETDHVLMQPIPNEATPTTPAGFDFGYMHAGPHQNSIIQKYWPEGTYESLDPVGPSPVIIHLDQLRAITPKWLDFSLGLRSTKDAEAMIQGWVQEMWGYSIAAASLGIRHKVLRNFQTEGGSLTSVAKDFHKSAYIFHYTYGIEYTLKGKPQGVNQIGEWSLDKRHYGSDYPPKNLEPPPEGANALAYWLLDAWNEASANIESWPLSKSMGTIGWRRERITPVQLEASAVAKQVHGTEWTWGGTKGFKFSPGGALRTPWGNGHWGVADIKGDPADAGKDGIEDGIHRCVDCLFADFANANHNLKFDFDASPPTFKSVRVGDMETVKGTLVGKIS